MDSHKPTESIKELRKLLPRGSTVYTIVRHVSSSGMFRIIDMFIVRKNRVQMISPSLLREVGFPYKKDKRVDGYRISGVGMDMGFSMVYTLSIKVWKDGYALKQEWA